MNCKPNDNAIVVRTIEHPCARGLLGRPVHVQSLDRVHSRLGPIWNVDGPHYVCGCGVEWVFVPDAWLQPLPPLPPEEAAHETPAPDEVAA